VLGIDELLGGIETGAVSLGGTVVVVVRVSRGKSAFAALRLALSATFTFASSFDDLKTNMSAMSSATPRTPIRTNAQGGMASRHLTGEVTTVSSTRLFSTSGRPQLGQAIALAETS
jgi:hypothetical protein